MKKILFIAVFVMYLIVIAPFSFGLAISDVYSKTGSNYAVITWKTDEEATSMVRYGTDKDALVNTESSIDQVTNHSIVLGDLGLTTKYFFEIISGGVIDNNLEQYYTFQTKSDNTPPVLEVNISEYVKSDRIDIKGTTELYVKLDLFVNNVKVRKKDPKAEEDFVFFDVLLSENMNTIRIDATDGDGNVESQTFTVNVDTKDPVVKINDVPGAVTTSSIKIKGSVDENATVSILVNAEEMYSANVQEFEQDVGLVQGNNLITIGVEDTAGNEVTITKKVIFDNEPPKFEAIDPETGSFFYEGHAVTGIRGFTEPYARVELYYDKEADGNPNARTTADENGRFEFEDFNLEYGYNLADRITGRGREDISDKPVTTEPGVIKEYTETRRDYGKADKIGVRVLLVATDSVGLKGETHLDYTIGTCFAGDMVFDIINMVEYQSPTILSPERLQQGTELISFFLKLDYQGIGENVEIKSIRIDKACEATDMQEDDEYKYSCSIMRSHIKRPNDDKTVWFVRYDLQELDIDGFTTDIWEDLTRSMVFPLKITVEYTADDPYDLPEEKGKRKFLTKCMPVSYSLDTSRIDPRDLPDGLLIGLQSIFNSTIEALNSVIPWVDQVNRFAGLSCFIGFLSKLVVVIFKNFSGYQEYFADRGSGVADACPAPGRTIDRTNLAEIDKKQDDLNNEELMNRCPQTWKWWESEAEFDSGMKWACDRFLCRPVPGFWTQGADIETLKVNIEKSTLCGEREGTENVMLRRLSKDECSKYVTIDYKFCYEYEGEIYVYTGDKPGTLEWQSSGAFKPGIQKELKVRQSGLNAQLITEPQQSKDCAKSCDNYKGKDWDRGGCLLPEDVSRLTVDDNSPVTKNNDGKIKCPRINNIQTQCYCWDEVEKPDEPGEQEEFDYRLNKVKLKQYSKYRYYEKRDLSGCFGQNNWFYPYSPVLNPRDFIPAFQCVCTSQVRARLIVLRNMLAGFNNCIEQVKVTGKYDTGVCKEVFTQYLCKWFSNMITYMMEGCAPFSGSEGELGIGDTLQMGAGSIFGGVQEAAQDLMNDYDNAALRDYFGVGEGAIAQTVCMGALTGDWGLDFEGFMDAAYMTPFHTAVQAFPAEREYLTWDPSTEQSTYEYRIGWLISAGCDITSYDVRLGCISEGDFYSGKPGISCEKARNPSTSEKYNSLTGCDCMTNPSEFATGRGPISPSIHQGRGIQQGAFESKSVHITQDSVYRYDHVMIRLNVADSRLRKECFPEGHEDGIFYFPISDLTPKDVFACRLDVNTGKFICDAGQFFFGERGTANFGKVECDKDYTCEDKVYYVGDPLILETVEVWNLGPEKCMHWEVTNRKGQTVRKGYEEIPEFEDESTKKTFNGLTLVGNIDISDISKVPTVVTSSPANSGMIHETSKDGDVRPGVVSVWFVDVDGDGFGDEIIIGKNEGRGEPFGSDEINWINEAALKFKNPFVKKSEKCESSSGEEKFCQKYTLSFRTPTIDKNEEVLKDQVWNIHFDIRALPENGTGSCEDATEEDIIYSRGSDQTVDKKTRISVKSKESSYRCTRLSGEVGNENTDWCDCDGKKELKDVGEDDPLIYKDVNDCDGDTKKYCYYHKLLDSHKCEEFPRCFPGSKKNNVACDCDLDGFVNEECKGYYCYKAKGDTNPRCYIQKQSVRAPYVDVDKSKIGGVSLSKFIASNPVEIPLDSFIFIVVEDDNHAAEELKVYVQFQQDKDTKKIPIEYDSSASGFVTGQIFKEKETSNYFDIIVTEPDGENPSGSKNYYYKIKKDTTK